MVNGTIITGASIRSGPDRRWTTPWIESHTVLIRHRKLLQLAVALRLKPVTVLGHLHALWHAVLEQQEDGDLTNWPDEMIAQAACYTGDARKFVSQLRSKTWLDGNLVHDWLDYAGRYLTFKYRTSNPTKLRAIYKRHKVAFSQTKDRSKGNPKDGHKSDNLPNQPTVPDLPNQPTNEAVLRFDEFWKAFPDRAGKKLEKNIARLRFYLLSVEDQKLCIQAATNYAFSIRKQGISAKDPKRWIRDGKGEEPWRDWIEAPVLTVSGQKCRGLNGVKCESYAGPSSVYCDEHKQAVIDVRKRLAGEVGPEGGGFQANGH